MKKILIIFFIVLISSILFSSISNAQVKFGGALGIGVIYDFINYRTFEPSGYTESLASELISYNNGYFYLLIYNFGLIVDNNFYISNLYNEFYMMINIGFIYQLDLEENLFLNIFLTYGFDVLGIYQDAFNIECGSALNLKFKLNTYFGIRISYKFYHIKDTDWGETIWYSINTFHCIVFSFVLGYVF